MTPPKLNEAYRANFATLLAAAKDEKLSLVSAIRKTDNKPVALICAMNYVQGMVEAVPLAVMIEGNPYEIFDDPISERG